MSKTQQPKTICHKKRQAITKAIKKESSLGGVVGIPALGDILKGK